MKEKKKENYSNGFLITCISCVVIMLAIFYLGFNYITGGTAATEETCDTACVEWTCSISGATLNGTKCSITTTSYDENGNPCENTTTYDATCKEYDSSSTCSSDSSSSGNGEGIGGTSDCPYTTKDGCETTAILMTGSKCVELSNGCWDIETVDWNCGDYGSYNVDCVKACHDAGGYLSQESCTSINKYTIASTNGLPESQGYYCCGCTIPYEPDEPDPEPSTPTSTPSTTPDPTPTPSDIEENPKTGFVLILLVWVIGVGAMGYSAWYYANLKKKD